MVVHLFESHRTRRPSWRACDGGGRALPKGALLFRPASLSVRVLPPLSADEGAGGAKERIALSVRERIVAARDAKAVAAVK